jgi:hypothetical protein
MLGKVRMKSSYFSITRLTWVCWSMISDMRIA